MSDNESSLVDDEDEIGNHLGSLSFTEDGRFPKFDSARMKDTFSTSELKASPKPVPHTLHFEVTDAQINTENKTKFVVYTVLIKTNCYDLSPVSIERRYSHFAELNTRLRKEFPSIMSEVIFPKKQLLGNFKPQTIAERSRSFEQFLCHLVHIPTVHLSKPFKTFFYGEISSSAHKLFLDKAFGQCIPILQRRLQLQKKLYGDLHEDTVGSLSALTVCFLETDCKSQAQVCSQCAVRGLQSGSQLLVPLLQVCIRLCWELGREKQALEQQLEALSSGQNTHNADSLVELVGQMWKVD